MYVLCVKYNQFVNYSNIMRKEKKPNAIKFITKEKFNLRLFAGHITVLNLPERFKYIIILVF